MALALVGDGGTSEGDFHEALNFAGVLNAPVVFLVQNNGYAISVPLSKQTAAPTLAHKAVGYGIPGRLVDGNDAAAVYAVLQEAVEHARAGRRPDAGRGDHLPAGGPHQRRRRRSLPPPGGGGRLAGARPADPAGGRSCAAGLLGDAEVAEVAAEAEGGGRPAAADVSRETASSTR